MKDFIIDGKRQRVFVLKQTDDRVAYIPIKDLHRIDYERLNDLEKNLSGQEMLLAMSKKTFNNGVNALVQYEDIIQVMDVKGDVGIRVPRPTERKPTVATKATSTNAQVMVEILQKLTELAVEKKEEPAPKPTRKAPVRKTAATKE